MCTSLWNQWLTYDWWHWSLWWLGSDLTGGVLQLIWYVNFVSAGAIAYVILVKEQERPSRSEAPAAAAGGVRSGGSS